MDLSESEGSDSSPSSSSVGSFDGTFGGSLSSSHSEPNSSESQVGSSGVLEISSVHLDTSGVLTPGSFSSSDVSHSPDVVGSH